jgi:hypothetical protein
MRTSGWRSAFATYAAIPSSFSPLATILSSSSGKGRCNSSALGASAASQGSTSVGVVRITGTPLMNWRNDGVGLRRQEGKWLMLALDWRALGAVHAAPETLRATNV